MLFACDLDQTLIYSRNALQRLDAEGEASRVVEHLDNEPLSYMTHAACAALRELQTHATFVPMTTRTTAQYRRIDFPLRRRPRYAIVTNGARILRDNQVDTRWASHISARLQRERVTLDDVERVFKESFGGSESWVLKLRRAEQYFIYAIVNRATMPMAMVDAFRRWLVKRGWSLSLQGRKLYFVPESIQKDHALAYLREELGDPQVAAAGDSALDLSALDVADHGFVPRHGEIIQRIGEEILGDHVTTTDAHGPAAAEEILAQVIELAKAS